MNNTKVIKQLINQAGGQSALARAIGVTQSHVWAWLNRNKRVPAAHVLKIEKIFGISRHDLRPDIYPTE